MPTRGAGTAVKAKTMRFTGQDAGGPREQKAHLEETQFKIIVRDDERNGYWIEDPSNGSRVTGSRRNKNGPPKPPMRLEMRLRNADDVRYAVESDDKNLDIIYRERDLIKHMRRCGYDNPVEAASMRLKAEMKVWDKAKEIGVIASDYVDAEIQGIDPREIAKDRIYKLVPIKVMDKERYAKPSKGGKS